MILGTACVSFRESDKKVFRKFKETSITPVIDYADYNGKKIRYISSGKIDNALPTIIFIHGAPGSAGNYLRYLKDTDLIKQANLVSVDRLGYGYSEFGEAETSIEKQAEGIYAIAEEYNLKRILLVGWSYGVPITAKMALKYPEVKHSVLVAGAISPEDEKFFGIAKMARWKLTKWMVPIALKVADEEKMAHVNELNMMLDDWQQIKTPMTYYHGTKDNIVPFKNMEFIKRKMSKNILKDVTVEGADHFILSKHFDLIKEELLNIINSLKND